MSKQPIDSIQISSSYLEGPPRQVPGFQSLHTMVALLLGERVPPLGRVLVLGAGGGLELKALAEAQPGWTFDGIDPSYDMLELAKKTVGEHHKRIQFHEGYINSAPLVEFDGALALLTFHFIPRKQRFDTLAQLQVRLKKGAPLIIAHLSFPQTEPERSQWISRHLYYSGTPAEHWERSRHAMMTKLSILSPTEEEQMLRYAGFKDISLFYAGLSFKGWIAYAT